MKRKYTNEELKGKKFNYLKLQEPINRMVNGVNRIFWQCQCDCGQTAEYREDYITNNKAQSCGCKHPRNNKGNQHSLWRGKGQLNGQYISMIRCSAKKRDIEYNVTTEYLWDIFQKQDGKCALSGMPINFESYRNKQAGAIQTASLDRIDSSKGYIVGNLQWIHKDINLMKNHFHQQYFIEICKKIVDFKSPEV